MLALPGPGSSLPRRTTLPAGFAAGSRRGCEIRPVTGRLLPGRWRVQPGLLRGARSAPRPGRQAAALLAEQAAVAIGGERLEGVAQATSSRRVVEQTRLEVAHDVAGPSRARCDHRHARRRRLAQRVAAGLLLAG